METCGTCTAQQCKHLLLPFCCMHTYTSFHAPSTEIEMAITRMQRNAVSACAAVRIF